MNAPQPANDAKRIEALESLGIMDTPSETAFDEIAWLAAHACGSRYAQINFVHTSRVWTKANIGFPETEQRRNLSPCAYAVSSGDMVVIPDTYEDERTKLNPLVIQGPRIRFYAGVPLLTEEAHAIGTLCVMDTDPHSMTVAQGGALWALSRQVMTNLRAGHATESGGHPMVGDDDAQDRARQHAARIVAMASQMPAILWTTDNKLRFTATLGAACETFHMRQSEVVGRTLQEYFGTDDADFTPTAVHLEVLRDGSPGPLRWSGWGHTLEVRISPLRDKAGAIEGCLGIALDVTERAAIDRAANRVRDDFRTLVEVASRAVAIDGHAVERSEGTGVGGGQPLPGEEIVQLMEGIHRQTA